MALTHFDLVIIGSGPGGYVAAVRASQLGMNVAVVERDRLGGVCLNWGCIPTKALLKSADVFATLAHAKDYGIIANDPSFDFPAIIKRSRQVADRMAKGVEFLFKKHHITHFAGTGRLIKPDQVAVVDDTGNITHELSARFILIATGARPRSIPGVPIDGSRVISSKHALTLEKLPQSMIVIGAGAIGMEFAYFYHTFGCQVTILEMMPTVLPIEDAEIADAVARSFKKSKISIHTNSLVKQVTAHDQGVSVVFETNNQTTELQAEMALMAIGVQGNYEGLGLEELGIAVEKSYIKINKTTYQTSIDHIYAIGDIIGPPWLAHVASAEGICAVEHIKGMAPKPIDYANIPGCTYCQPQVASIGLSEQKALELGYSIKVGRFPFVANGKSLAMGEREGFVKLIFDARTELLLGAHIVHAEATELIGELSVIKSNAVTASALVKTIHAHPTLSEAVMEAAAAARGEAIHG
ncbi:MAG: dihydrolipoyl dehydrogenase [candidate division KSB1 bacterium]|nr:dihydrolipoyl dehydrogenase [candidate division KSB1 bacterium]MDZ7339709.1 dihydrolipoyl dehydrogenase [candidate division KSB1 bacterium]